MADKNIMGLNAWRNASGVRNKRGETNRALAERDYSVECKAGPGPIVVFEGYWIWWCIPHHQPMPWCEKGVYAKKIAAVAAALRNS